MDPDDLIDSVPDLRDGLTRLDRIVLFVMRETEFERNGRSVPTAMLYGRVLEYVNISEPELQTALKRLGVQK